MNYLLDTHAYIWYVEDNKYLRVVLNNRSVMLNLFQYQLLERISNYKRSAELYFLEPPINELLPFMINYK
jgi:hypothetical protein